MNKRLYLILVSLLLSILAPSCKNNLITPVNPKINTIVYEGQDMLLYTMNADGTNNKSFFNLVGMEPQYTPDGNKITYIWWDKNSNYDYFLYATDVQNGKTEKLAFLNHNNISGPYSYSWSPDKTKILISIPSGVWTQDIYLFDVNVKVLKHLISGLGFSMGPKWSPDQKQIYFSNWSAKDSTYQGYIMDSDGSNLQPALGLGKNQVLDMNWSPDGSKITFMSLALNTQFGLYNLFLYNKKDSTTKQITYDGGCGTGIWSPDGDKILFSDSGNRTSGDLYLVNSDGTNKKQITNNHIVNMDSYLWSPDGEKILYTVIYGNNIQEDFHIRVVNSDGSNDIDTGVHFVGAGVAWKPN